MSSPSECLYGVSDFSRGLGVTRQRGFQLVRELGIEPALRIGRLQFFTAEQIEHAARERALRKLNGRRAASR